MIPFLAAADIIGCHQNNSIIIDLRPALMSRNRKEKAPGFSGRFLIDTPYTCSASSA